MPRLSSNTARVVVISMIKAQILPSVLLMVLIVLIVSCSAVEQRDHDDPIKPHPRVIDTAVVESIKHTNKQWYAAVQPIKESATE